MSPWLQALVVTQLPPLPKCNRCNRTRYELDARIDQIRELAAENGVDVSEEIRQLETRSVQLHQEIFSGLSPAQRLQVARHPHRPSTLDYIHMMSGCIGCVKAGRSICLTAGYRQRIQNLGLLTEVIARMLRPYKHTQPMLPDTISNH